MHGIMHGLKREVRTCMQSKKDVKRLFKNIVCVLYIIIIATTLIFVNDNTREVDAYGYGTNVLINPKPSGTAGWEVSKNIKWQDGEESDGEFKGTNNDPIIARQRFNFSDRDIYRINNGEITVSASGHFWAPGWTTMWAHLKLEFYTKSGVRIGSDTDENAPIAKYEAYSWGNHNVDLKIENYTVPAGTGYIIYEAKNDDNR